MLTQHSTGLTTLHSLVTFLIGLNLCVVSFWKLLKSSKSQLLKYMYCCFPFFFINTDSLILIKLLNLIDLNILFSDIVPPFFKTMPACVMVRYFFFLSLETSSKYVEGFLGYTYCAKIQCYCITIKVQFKAKDFLEIQVNGFQISCKRTFSCILQLKHWYAQNIKLFGLCCLLYYFKEITIPVLCKINRIL